jgi:hypothetical protein
MSLKPLIATISLMKKPVLWIPGIFAGAVFAAFLYLAFSGGEFIAGKMLFLSVVLFPFFVAGAIGCMSSDLYTLGEFQRSAVRYFFPVLLPIIIVICIICILVIAFSIPFAIVGLGSDPSMIVGLFIGICMPVFIFSFYADNVSVAEGLKVFASLKRSMIIASQSFFSILSCIVITGFGAIFMSMMLAMVWGMVLAEKFAPYLDLGMTEQQEIFSGFSLADWQGVLGPEGIAITAGMIGIYTAVIVSAFIVYKHQCYSSVSTIVPEVIEQVGEYDEKGRWYKY